MAVIEYRNHNPVEYEKREHLVIIRMNRPEALNAMNHDLLLGLAEAWMRYNEDDDAFLAILTGVGRSFSVGMDVKERLEHASPDLGLPVTSIQDLFWMDELHKPTIAAINGFAFGGGLYLASKADFRVAGESTSFRTGAVFGGVTGFELLQAENFPPAVLAEVVVGGVLTARRAYEVGFLNRVVPDEQVMEASIELAETVLANPPISVHRNLKLLRDFRRAMGHAPRWLTQQEKDYFEAAKGAEDTKEALRAFQEKRKPIYKGR